MKDPTEIAIGGKRLTVSNLDKVLYPQAQFTKGQVIDYYVQVAPVLLPHLKDRPLTLKRYPNGVDREFFYEKRCPEFRPRWVETASLWSKTNEGKISYCLANNLATLIWAANLADLELHTSLARHQKPDRPTMMVFDLDPGPGTDILDCAEAGIWIRDLLKEMKLESLPKTSGSKGLQIYVPLNTNVTFGETKRFSRALADGLAKQKPDKIVAQMSKQLRQDKVFIDWSQNDVHKTTVCAYSLRAKEKPMVSMPLPWREVEQALKSRSSKKLSFDSAEAMKRVHRLGDLFAPVLTLKQKLPELRGIYDL
jgi:bifunctional non-homologous end joining protein LigD